MLPVDACDCTNCADRPDTTPLDGAFRTMLMERHIHDTAKILSNARGTLFESAKCDLIELALPKRGDNVYLNTPVESMMLEDFDDFARRRSSSESTRSAETAVSDGGRSLRVSLRYSH